MNLASEIYKADAANQIELCKILWEIRFLQSAEDIQKQLQVVDSAMLAQVWSLVLGKMAEMCRLTNFFAAFEARAIVERQGHSGRPNDEMAARHG